MDLMSDSTGKERDRSKRSFVAINLSDLRFIAWGLRKKKGGKLRRGQGFRRLRDSHPSFW